MWFKNNSYYLESSYNPEDKMEAFKKVNEKGKFPLGLIFYNPQRTIIEEEISAYKDNKEPLYKRRPDLNKIHALIEK